MDFQEILQIIKDNLTIRVKDERVRFSDDVRVEVSLHLNDEEISSDWITIKQNPNP